MRLLALLLLCAGCAAGPVLHDADFDRLTHGMGQAEVRRSVGEPSTIETFPRQRQIAWTYAYYDDWGYLANLSVIFDGDGRVIGKVHIRKDCQDN